jgi:hypothetical protein
MPGKLANSLYMGAVESSPSGNPTITVICSGALPPVEFQAIVAPNIRAVTHITTPLQLWSQVAILAPAFSIWREARNAYCGNV